MLQQVTGGGPFGAQLIGSSRAHAAMLAQLSRISSSDAPTLIEGETGSGKELAARAIHYDGPRRQGPFVPVNCGALPDTLIESELFGVQRGAFTDARNSRHGLVAEAEGGTLFLDEVDALSTRAQVTLLRFLQDQRYRPLGTTREQHSDVRLIAAANRPLQTLVAQQVFRADLLYRLKILHLVMPPLRERSDDVERLALHFIAVFAAKYSRDPLPLNAETVAWMHQYSWPGNIRELESWVHRQFLMCCGREIVHEEMAGSSSIPPLPAAPLAPSRSFAQAKAEAVQRFERDYVASVLEEAGGNVSHAARLAGKERRAFGKLVKKYELSVRTSHVLPGG